MSFTNPFSDVANFGPSEGNGGIYLEYVDFREVFENTIPTPTFVNDLERHTEDQRRKLQEMIRTDYTDDKLSIVPTCECGHTHGADKRNTRCPLCHTVVTSYTERPFQSTLWLRPPEGVDYLINPNFWYIIRQIFTKNKFSMLDYLGNSSYLNKDASAKRYRARVSNLGIKRSWNYLTNNLVDIAKDLLDINPEIGTKKYRAECLAFITEFAPRCLVPYVPLPNKSMFITESTGVGVYTDFKSTTAMDAILTFYGIDDAMPMRTKENHTCKGMTQLAEYHYYQYKDTLGGKPGDFRQHIVGSRINFGGRAVITSLAEAHRYDNIEIPWTFAIGLLRKHLTGQLLRKGMSPNEINLYLIKYAKRYDKTLDDIFKKFIADSPDMTPAWLKEAFPEFCTKYPGNGLGTLLQRNPTLARGSAQHLKIIKVKTDPSDNTISMGTLVLAEPNAD